jgi:hypothetical protein
MNPKDMRDTEKVYMIGYFAVKYKNNDRLIEHTKFTMRVLL